MITVQPPLCLKSPEPPRSGDVTLDLHSVQDNSPQSQTAQEPRLDLGEYHKKAFASTPKVATVEAHKNRRNI